MDAAYISRYIPQENTQMKSDEYEQLTKDCYDKFLNNPNEKLDCKVSFGRKNRIKGISGYMHQIDVSVEAKDRFWLIECKKWNKRISVAEYLTFLGRIRDISLNRKGQYLRGVIITKSGWQSGVNTFHELNRKQISLFEFSERAEIGEKIHTAFISAKSSLRLGLEAKIEDGVRNQS